MLFFPFSRKREKVPEGRMRGSHSFALTLTPLPHAGEGKSAVGHRLSAAVDISWLVFPSGRHLHLEFPEHSKQTLRATSGAGR
jgi:hypothetical protein